MLIREQILYFGLPSAAILSAELYRQTTQQTQPQLLSPASSIPNLPRSELIRNLSVFVSAMEWASSPSDGNYSLCCRARRHLSRVLDEILEQSTNLSTPTPGAQTVSLAPPLDSSAPYEGNNDATLGLSNGIGQSGMSLAGNEALPPLGLDDNWQNVEFFLDGLVDSNVDTMDWNLGL